MSLHSFCLHDLNQLPGLENYPLLNGLTHPLGFGIKHILQVEWSCKNLSEKVVTACGANKDCFPPFKKKAHPLYFGNFSPAHQAIVAHSPN